MPTISRAEGGRLHARVGPKALLLQALSLVYPLCNYPDRCLKFLDSVFETSADPDELCVQIRLCNQSIVDTLR